MKLVVGLGNPGRKYEGNRHNIGFVVVDEFAELLQHHPAFIALFARICRVGRSLRVHLLLATQSLKMP